MTYDAWKDDEIILYLQEHPEIAHYCVLDDCDGKDLEKMKNHLVVTKYYSKNKEEGLLESHREKIGQKLELDNDIVKKRGRKI